MIISLRIYINITIIRLFGTGSGPADYVVDCAEFTFRRVHDVGVE